MPKYVYYILLAVGFVLFFEIVAHNFYEEIGHVAPESYNKYDPVKPQSTLTLKAIDSLIDKKIAERDTITLRVVSSGFLDATAMVGTDIQKTFPTVSGELTTPGSVERVISISNPDLSDEEYFRQLQNEYLKEATRELAPGRLRTDMVIRYYKHPVDGRGIYKLRGLKYYIHERNVNDSILSKMPSNALFYGDNIKDEDIKIVAYTLMENGIPIKSIEPSEYGRDWKKNSIEIGSDSSLLDAKALTLGQVRAFIH